MFRAPCAYRQEVKIVLYSLWCHHTYGWSSPAQVESGLRSDVGVGKEECCAADLRVSSGSRFCPAFVGRPTNKALKEQ